jgi:hypothetical protein
MSFVRDYYTGKEVGRKEDGVGMFVQLTEVKRLTLLL